MRSQSYYSFLLKKVLARMMIVITFIQIFFGWAPRNTEALNTEPIPSNYGYMQMVSSKNSACGLRDDNTLWCWGENTYNQLGLESVTYSPSVPVKVGGLPAGKKILSVSMVDGFNPHQISLFALMDDGSVYAWGLNEGTSIGSLGVGDTVNTYVNTPTQVIFPAGKQAKQLLVQSSDTAPIAFAVMTDGTVYTWGANQFGIAGIGSFGDIIDTPTMMTGFPTGQKVLKIFSAKGHAEYNLASFYAILDDGSVWAWGGNQCVSGLGCLGVGDSTNNVVMTPTPVVPFGSGTIADSIIIGSEGGFSNFSFAITSSGALYSWGQNTIGQLGLGNTITTVTPTLINSFPSGTEVTKVFTSDFGHIFALLDNGTMYAWGKNSLTVNGNTYADILGTGDANANLLTPMPVTGFPSGKVIKNFTVGKSSNESFTIFALMNDDTLYAWGDNARNYLSIGTGITYVTSPTLVQGFPSYNTVIDILHVEQDDTVSWDNTMFALMDDGIVYSWGYNGKGETCGDGGCLNIISGILGKGGKDTIDTARNITGFPSGRSIVKYEPPFVILDDGTLWAWGANTSGELGVGDTLMHYDPIQVTGFPPGTQVEEIYQGYSNDGSQQFALLDDGTLWAWGENTYGQLGVGDTNTYITPTQVTGFTVGTQVASVILNGSDSYAILDDGTLWAWGWNGYLRLGVGDTDDRLVPTQVVGIPVGRSVTSFTPGSFAILDDETLWAWGDNEHGRLGLGDTVNRTSAVQVTGFSGGLTVASIFTPTNSTYAIMNDGSLWAWGNNLFYGSLGLGDTIDRSTPTKVTAFPVGTRVVSLVGQYGTMYAILDDGTLWAWGGGNGDGQLGLGDMVNRTTPTQITTFPSGRSVTKVYTDGDSTFAILDDGTLWAWGRNDVNGPNGTVYNYLGLSDTSDLTKPTQVTDLPAGIGVISISMEYGSILAELSDGTFWAWGDNLGGRLGYPTSFDSFLPNQVTGLPGGPITSYKSTYVLYNDGSLWTWGDNKNAERATMPFSIPYFGTPSPVLGPYGEGYLDLSLPVTIAAIFANSDSGSFLNTQTGSLPLLSNDTYSGSVATTGSVSVSLTGSNPLTGSFIDQNTGNFIFPPSSLTGVYSLMYEICDRLNVGNCSSTGITVNLTAYSPTISALPDSASFQLGSGGSVPILANDTYSGAQANTGSVSITLMNNGGIAGGSIDPTYGTFIVPTSTPTGNYTAQYEICSIINPTTCSTADISISITRVVAYPDSITLMQGMSGSIDVLSNDMTGTTFTSQYILVDLIYPHSLTGSIMDNSGVLSIPGSVLPGTYTLNYNFTICDADSNCEGQEISNTTTITVHILSLPSISATADSGTFLNTQTGSLPLLSNDTYSGNTATTGSVSVNLTDSSSLSGVFIDPDTGNLIIPPFSGTGSYTLMYEICDRLNVGNCSSTGITVNLTAPPVPGIPTISAVMDSASFPDGSGGVVSVLSNDSYSGDVATLDFVTVSLTGVVSISGVSINGSGEMVIPSSASSGTYTLYYEICDRVNVGNCSSAPVSITVVGTPVVLPPVLPAISALSDSASFLRTSTGEISVLSNDSYSGGIATIGNVSVSLTGTVSIPGAFIDPVSGKLVIPPSSSTGIFSLTYQICDRVNVGNCSSAPVTITLTENPPPVTPPAPPSGGTSTPPSSPGVGGNTSVIVPIPNSIPSPVPQMLSSVVAFVSPSPSQIFPSYVPSCTSAVTNLDDPRLIAYYRDIGVENASNPDRRLTRAEFLKLVLNAAKINLTNISGKTRFHDVKENLWYAPYIAYATEKQIVRGDEEGNFRPSDVITRGEASKIFVQSLGVKPITESLSFTDVSGENTLAPYIQAAYQDCLVHGRHTIDGEPIDGKPRVFEDWDGISLGETAKVLYNAVY